jgi:CelD/BcsL family acetyltransferase involved in cellulose biosynthesis
VSRPGSMALPAELFSERTYPHRDGHDAARADTTLDVRVARTLDELDALAGAWRSLEGHATLATLQHAWVVGAVEAYGERRAPSVLLAYRGPDLVGIAPLWRSSRPDRRLVLIASEELREPMDILVADDEARGVLAKAMLDAHVPLALPRLHWDGRTARALRSATGAGTRLISRAGAPLPWIALDDGWADPLARLSSRRRSDLRRAERRARALGGTAFEVLEPDADEVVTVVEEAIQVEARGWKGRSGTALLHDAARGSFFRTFALRAAEQGTLRVSFLRIDGQAAATQLGVEFGGRYWIYKIGYDERFGRASPGVLLMNHMIGWAARRGLCGFEMMGAAESWLRLWTTDEHPSETLHLYPLTARGAHALAADAVRAGGLRIVRARAARRRAATSR